jgi:O-antigen ligase
LIRLVLIVGALWMLAQAALTFSRGGVVTTLATLLVAAFFLLRDRRSRTTFVGGALLLLFLWFYLVFPALENFTGGAITARMTDTNLTGRDKIVQADLLAFRDRPFTGVGIGQSPAYHAILFRHSAAHTEFTRWLAEHGLFGLVALLLFSSAVVRRLLAEGSPFAKALMLSLTFWALLFMSHAAMRLAAPSFTFGLAAATFVLDDPDRPPVREGE